MDFEFVPLQFEPQNGSLLVWVHNADHPQGEKIQISVLKDDGTWYSESEIRARIEAAIPVHWFDLIRKRNAAAAPITHISSLLGKRFKVTRDVTQQGVLGPATSLEVTVIDVSSGGAL